MAQRISHVIGFDDAPFPRSHRGDVLSVGAVYAGPVEPAAGVYVQRAGISLRDTEMLIERLALSAERQAARATANCAFDGRRYFPGGKPTPGLDCEEAETMSKIMVTRRHAIGEKKARAAVDRFAKTLREDLDAEYHWEGSTLKFTRTGASGQIDVGDDDVKVEIRLSVLLTPLKGQIEKTIEENMDEYLNA